MTCQAGPKKTNPAVIPATRASAILTTRLRSSRKWSMSGIRPSGFCCRRERTNRSPAMRAPARAPGRVAMTGVRARLAGLPGRLPARSAAGEPGRCLGRWLSAHRPRFRLVLVQAVHLLLQDAHRLAERARRGRELLRPEQHDDHQGDDQDLPRAIEQVTNHFQILFMAVSRAWLRNRAQDQAKAAAAPPGGTGEVVRRACAG